jgi:hypothetical protein
MYLIATEKGPIEFAGVVKGLGFMPTEGCFKNKTAGFYFDPATHEPEMKAISSIMHSKKKYPQCVVALVSDVPFEEFGQKDRSALNSVCSKLSAYLFETPNKYKDSLDLEDNTRRVKLG